MTQLIILFSALVVGYLIKKLPISHQGLNHVLFLVVMLILFVMGYDFGYELNSLAAQLGRIFISIITFTGLIFVFNFVASAILFNKETKQLNFTKDMSVESPKFMTYFLQSAKYLSIVGVGIVFGALLSRPLMHFENIINVLLILLLFVIGHQMRISGTTLRQVIVNKAGIKLALIILFSSLIAGVCAAFILNMPVHEALAISSGFGWYTLSSVLVGSLIHENYSAISFFVDFNRELMAIILLPALGRFFPYTMVGSCGATAMDFSLPVIKQNLGQQMVIIAISSGMILSIAVPFLLPLFAKL